MTRRILSLIVLLFGASCGEDLVSPTPCRGDRNIPLVLPEGWGGLEGICAAVKLTTTCPPPEPRETVCPTLLFGNLLWAINERRGFALDELLAPDFALVDETNQTRIVGRAHEVKRVSHVLAYYRGVEFDIDLSSRAFEHECMVVRGLVEMRLWVDHDTGLIVNDQTVLTACPQPEDGLWRLTEWRILRSIPPTQTEDGFEVVTWGEVKGKEE